MAMGDLSAGAIAPERKTKACHGGPETPWQAE
jgi:hypothetical protein